MKKKKFITLAILLISSAIAVTSFTACNSNTPGESQSPPAGSGSPATSDSGPVTESIGAGDKSFILEVTDDKGKINKWIVSTDEETVGAALLSLGLIKGDTSELGLMVTHVNNLRADYFEDKAYWAFYIDGEFASIGADAAIVDQDMTYAFVYTPA